MSEQIEAVLHETRCFPPPSHFAKTAHIKNVAEYEKMYHTSIRDPDVFWAQMANDHLSFFKKWDHVLEFNDHRAKWFEGAELNVAYNCLDRHTDQNKIALIWEGENGEKRTFTYAQLKDDVSRAANMLKQLGVGAEEQRGKGEKNGVAIYMPLIPEAIIAMLACARIGATHTVIFGGFSAQALRDRINSSGCKVLLTADGGYRKGSIVPTKHIADDACNETPSIQKIVVVQRTHEHVYMKPERDAYWHILLSQQSPHCPPTHVPAEHPLFILYTSGTTGKPKGLLHTTAGYLLSVTLSSKYVFDLKPQDVLWCSADVGWITGHSYLAYGPLSNGATVFLYEGALTHPAPDRVWKMIADHRVSIFYTAPTAIRSFIRLGNEWPQKHDLSGLRLLGSVGEPINPEAWMWYHTVIGHERCPIIDTWWQTETGSMAITPLPGAIATKPGSATVPFFGYDVAILKKDGSQVAPQEGGFLCIKKPWPSMARTIVDDHERYKKTYWQEIEGVYFTGDGARQDADGYYWIVGRIDDVLNVSGHRLGTMEVESVVVQHPNVAECAVVGRPDPIKGQGIVVFATLKSNAHAVDTVRDEIKKLVEKEIGAIARPDDIRLTDALPKTRSGKIMRRLLRELAAQGTITGDTTTLEDFSVIEKLKAQDDD